MLRCMDGTQPCASLDEVSGSILETSLPTSWNYMMPVHSSKGVRLCHHQTRMLHDFPAQDFIRLQIGFARNVSLRLLLLYYGETGSNAWGYKKLYFLCSSVG